MGSSIKINSISIDLVGAANEIDMVKCDHFSIRGLVAEIRERNQRKCWPFSEDSISLVDQQSYPLPSLSVPKFRWWRCVSCIRDINADGRKDNDCRLHSNSRTTSKRKLDASSSVIPSKSNLNLLTVTDKKESKTDIAGNVVEENENVNCESCQKDDQSATFNKKVHPRSMDASTVRKKSRKLVSPEQVHMRSKEKLSKPMDTSRKENRKAVSRPNVEAMPTFGSSEIAGVIEDTPKAIKNHRGSRILMELDECDKMSSESVSGLQRRKTRKVRLLSELLGKANTKASGSIRKEESPSKRDSVNGRKRKLFRDDEWRTPQMTPENNYASRILSSMGRDSENAFKSCDSDGNISVSGIGSQPSTQSQSTDSGFDRDPIKGKQKNRRFQVVDEYLPAVPRETSQKNDADPLICDPGKRTLESPVHSLLTGKDLVPCGLRTQRKERKLSSAKKKRKNPIIDNEKSTLITFNTAIDEENQVKLRKPELPHTAPIKTMVQFSSLDSHLASEGHSRKYSIQLNDKPLISLPLQGLSYKEDDHGRPRDAGTNYLRDFGSSSQSNVGGWVRTGVDVDLSSNNNTKSLSFENANLRRTPFSEVVDPSRVLQKDASGADSKGKAVVVQEHLGAPISHNHDRKDDTSEQIDDIPMEIVELMAKNQYERCLPDREEDISNNNQEPSQAKIHTSKNALLIDLNETYDNGVSLDDNTSGQPKPCGSNIRKDNARREELFPLGKQKSLEFFSISQLGQPYAPSGVPIFSPTQDNRASSIRFSGIDPSQQTSHNCHWLGNAATMGNQNPCPSSVRVLRGCNTCQSIPQQYREASHPVWPTSMISQGHNPVSFSTPQKLKDQSTKMGMLSQASSNEDRWNLNFVSEGKTQYGSNSEFSFGCKHAGVSKRSMDSFSSESSIPALHLLSLMDPRLRSSTPADHSANTKFTKRHFPPVHQSKESTELQTGNCSKTAYSTKHLPFDFYGKRVTPETSHNSFAITPPVGTSSFSFQKSSKLTFQAPWSHQEKKTKRKEPFVPIYNNHEKSVFTSSNDQGQFQLLGASNSMMLPLKFHMSDNEKKQKTKGQSCNASAWPLQNVSGSTVCIINRNPADFTIPGPGNIYMLTPHDLEVQKRATFKKPPRLCKQDALKQNKKPVGPASDNV